MAPPTGGGPKTPRYKALGSLLREQIVAGRYPPDSRLPSEHQLSARFSVSRVTARQAIQLLERERLVRRIRGSGTYVNRLGPGNRPLEALRHAAVITIDMPPALNYFFSGIMAAERWLKERGGTLTITNIASSDLSGKAPPPVLQRNDIQGLLLNGIVNDAQARVIQNTDLPYLIVGNCAISRSLPQIRFAVGAMVRRAIDFLSKRHPGLPIVMGVNSARHHFMKEALMAYRQAIRAAPQSRPIAVEWTDDVYGKLDSVAKSDGARFAIILPENDLAPLMKFHRAHRIAPADQIIVQIFSPEMIAPQERADRYFIPASGEKIMTEAIRALAEMVQTGRCEHYQEIDAEIEGVKRKT
jgi:DNA-binding transcriptional regulator YhcF (GntR family)